MKVAMKATVTERNESSQKLTSFSFLLKGLNSTESLVKKAPGRKIRFTSTGCFFRVVIWTNKVDEEAKEMDGKEVRNHVITLLFVNLG